MLNIKNIQSIVSRLTLLGGLVLLGMAAAAQSVILVKPSAITNVTSTDDVAQIQKLAAGVGWEFEANEETTAALKRVNTRTIRCIHVDPVPGAFDKSGKFIVDPKPKEPTPTYNYIQAHLKTCRETGANPHIILADYSVLVPELINKPADYQYTQKDWDMLEQYYEAFFEYYLVTENFPLARFEFGNEPDINGWHAWPPQPKPAMGARSAYDAYFTVYKHVAAAAERVEAKYPGMKVRLGGPALAGPFTFTYGDFNWAVKFIRDCSEQKVKCDFLSYHFYGNVASLNGEYPSWCPSFADQVRTILDTRDRYLPGTEFWVTEWGPSYTMNIANSEVNANHIGAAWSMDMLNTMLNSKVDGALFLITTDMTRDTVKNLQPWPVLFFSPKTFGATYPTPIFHVIDMVSRLQGQRIESSHGIGVKTFATADPAKKTVQVLLWNYQARLPEGDPAIENGQREGVVVRLREVAKFFGTPQVTMRRWLVSENVSNAYPFLKKDIDPAGREKLQEVDNATYSIVDDFVDCGFAMPPSSVSLVEFTAK